VVVVEGEALPVAGAQLAVIRDGRVLLQLRLWPPGWELPGGRCLPGEDPAVCAARETEEETGLRVSVGGLAGVYDWRGLRSSGDAVYYGEISDGGRPRRTIESLSTRFVALGGQPRTTFPWIPQRMIDAVDVHAGGAPVHRVQPVGARHVLFFGMQWAAATIDAVRGVWRRLARGDRRAAR
jgi:8-oxo-dGTP pyrophosphatase MutT (NUDIX family)